MFSKSTIPVGLIQMECVLMEKEQNLHKALQFLSELAGKAKLVCLPELFTTGYNLDVMGDALYDLAEPIPGRTTAKFCQKGKEYEMAILGNLIEKDRELEGVLYDTSFLIDSRGKLIGKYRKTHLYPKEHQYFQHSGFARSTNRLYPFRCSDRLRISAQSPDASTCAGQPDVYVGGQSGWS
jgi:predicted amidohydrolase